MSDHPNVYLAGGIAVLIVVVMVVHRQMMKALEAEDDAASKRAARHLIWCAVLVNVLIIGVHLQMHFWFNVVGQLGALALSVFALRIVRKPAKGDRDGVDTNEGQ